MIKFKRSTKIGNDKMKGGAVPRKLKNFSSRLFRQKLQQSVMFRSQDIPNRVMWFSDTHPFFHFFAVITRYNPV